VIASARAALWCALAMLRPRLLHFVVWTAVGLFFFSQDVTRAWLWSDPTPWWRTLASWMAGVWISAAATPAVLWLGARVPIERATWLRSIAVHVVAAAAWAFAVMAAIAAVAAALGFMGGIPIESFTQAFLLGLVISVHNNAVSYAVIVGVQHAARYRRRLREREAHALRLELEAQALAAQLARAQLDALRMQIQPHFLFNTLNAIMVLVRAGRLEQAEDTLATLSDLLRCVLDDIGAQEVSLRRELEYVRLYLGIEQLRFGDRLRVQVAAEPDALDAAVPQLGLQPLVENAVRHGIGGRADAGAIAIAARRDGDRLEIRVRDDGPGVRESGTRAGIGLANTRARLRQLYGDGAALTLTDDPPGGAVATMTLPFRIAPARGEEVAELHAAHHADR